MTEGQTRRFAAPPFLVGTLLLFCALTFYYFAVLRVDYSKTALLDLGPHPDASEYFAQAKALLEDRWPSIQIGYDKLPSRYPFGYPALMLPWLKILPEADSILAPFRTNQTIGLFLLLAVFGFYTYLTMPVTGGLAVLLLATLPSFFTSCRSSLSEISTSALFVLAFMFAYLGLKEERRWKIYLSAIFLGLSLNVRVQSLFFAPLLLAMALFPIMGRPRRWFLHCVAVLIVFALAASPVLVLNTIQFHSPFKTGYGFWAPYFYEVSGAQFRKPLLFFLHYVPTNAAFLWREFSLAPQGFATANIFGTGTSFVAAFVLLICAGSRFVRLSRFVICAFLAGLSFLVATAGFSPAEGRFYLPFLILSVAVAVLPVTWAAKNLVMGRCVVAALAIFSLVVAACLGYPSRSGYKTVGINRSQAWDALHFTVPPRQSAQFVAQRDFLETFSGQPGIVLSDIDPAYLNALFPKPFIAAPLDGKHQYRWSRIWRYDRPQAVALIKRGLDQSLPIYALFVSQKDREEKASRLPELDGYRWTILDASISDKVAVLKLTPTASEDRMPF
jgi:hypothetical protein